IGKKRGGYVKKGPGITNFSRPGPIGRADSTRATPWEGLSNNHTNIEYRRINNKEHIRIDSSEGRRINNSEYRRINNYDDRRINNKGHKREAAPRPVVGGHFDINKLNNNYNFVPQALPGERGIINISNNKDNIYKQNDSKLNTNNKAKSKFKFNNN